MATALTSKDGALWIQPYGANTAPVFLGCKDLGDITIPESGIDLLRCFSPSGDGWDIIGEKLKPPEKITLSVEGLLQPTLEYLEVLNCAFNLFVLTRDCGRADHFANYIRGMVIRNVRRINKKYSGLVKREEDVETKLSVDLEAWPPAFNLRAVDIQRQATAGILGVSDIATNLDQRCVNECGTTLIRGQNAVAGSIAAAAVAASYHTHNSGTTWTVYGATPFAATVPNMSIQTFNVGRTTERVLIASGFVAAIQGKVGRSDDGGVTWATTDIGPAVAHGAAYGRGLFALDSTHIWLVGALGYIFFSSDGGVTWATQNAASIHAGSWNAVHFADSLNGFCCGAAGVCAKTVDGGNTWTATTIPVAQIMYTCWMLDANRIWVGGATDALFYSNDGGVTWTQRTFPGYVVGGAVKGISFVQNQDLIGFLASDTAAPVGSVLRTIDGGYSWDTITTPANSGLLGVTAIDESNAYTFGLVNAATGYIARATP